MREHLRAHLQSVVCLDGCCLAGVLCLVCLGQNRCQLAQLALARRGISLVYLSAYFSQTSSVVWHRLAGVFCLSLSQSWPTIEPLLPPPHPPPPPFTGCSLWKRKSSPNSNFQCTHPRPSLPSTAVGGLSCVLKSAQTQSK